MNHDRPNLIADIGGTNARFALVDAVTRTVLEPRTLSCADHPSLEAAVRAYLQQVGNPRPRHAVAAVATAVTGDEVRMTNHVWRFSVARTRAALGLESFKLINDFSALALALPDLDRRHCRKVGAGEAVPGQAMAVIGPGTGLGVSGSIPMGERRVILQGEGGHVAYGPQNPREAEVLAVIRRRYPQVSAERLVSGPGLTLLYEALTELDGCRVPGCAPGGITRMALQGYCAVAEEALALFCGILGTLAGDLALTLGARGGVYIGGGIVPSLGDFFAESAFRRRFEQHGRFTDYLARIPTYVIQEPLPALVGARAALTADHDYLGVTSRAA